jgi:hypothetical protein
MLFIVAGSIFGAKVLRDVPGATLSFWCIGQGLLVVCLVQKVYQFTLLE